ncbi:MAG: hypothetical protein ACKOE6_02395 [Flammeovirgaceae bacterium]
MQKLFLNLCELFAFLGFMVAANSTHTAVAQSEKGGAWALLNATMFRTRFHEELNDFCLLPEFDANIRAQEGKELTLKGYYLAFELPEHRIIISKYPYASCFFCGGAGPESVVEVNLKSKPPALRTDALITVKGLLKLNERDIDRLTFILEKAEIIR